MIGERPLPQFVRDLLSSPPRRGDGLNLWLYRTARVLHPYRQESEIVDLLRAATAGAEVKVGEIERAVQRSKAVAWKPGDPPTQRPMAWPKLNVEQRDAVIASGLGLVDLWELSPVRLHGDEPDAEDYVDALFPGNPLLCIGRTKYDFATGPRDGWHGRLSDMSLIVPSPMTARFGKTQEGKRSEHALDNTGPRRFLVVEQDNGCVDDQAAVLLHLAKSAPLVLAVHSGGKSIHGWFMAEGQTEDRLRKFMESAVILGADPATWTRSQFVRLPAGTREDGSRQTVYFFNPRVIL